MRLRGGGVGTCAWLRRHQVEGDAIAPILAGEAAGAINAP